MTRRVLLAGVLAGLLVSATVHGQTPSRVPLMVILNSGPLSEATLWLDRLKKALAALGWIDGRTLRIDIRNANGNPERMSALAREVVPLKPDIIYTQGTTAMLRAVAHATNTIPIVIGASGDLVGDGLARSLARPGGNLTGMTLQYHELEAKRLETLKDAVLKIRRVGALVNAKAERRFRETLANASRRLGLELQIFDVSSPTQIPAAIAALKKAGAEGLIVHDEPMLASSVSLVAADALAAKLPSISQSPRFAELGGLLQQGADILEVFERSAGHVDKILRGAKPADLPIEQPTKLTLSINLKTAKTLGLTIPPSLLARADQVIE